ADELVERLADAARKLTVGNGLDDGVFLGPVIRESHKERTIGYIETGVKEGARLVLDGRDHPAAEADGYFLGPTLFDHARPGMKIWQDEIFAPVLQVVRVSTLDEAIEIANASEFANGACLYTYDARAIRRFRETIDAGMLGINL